MSIYRLDKYLADMGCGTRSEVKNYIKKGRVSVNEEVVRAADIKIDTEKDQVVFDGQKVGYVEFEYYMLNKPQGVLSATEDRKQKTVIDLIETKNRKDLFPVGRLDKDTEGLLLITNDGQLAHNLLSPKKHVDKVYYAEIDSVVPDELIKEFANGVILDDEFRCMPAKLQILKKEEFVNPYGVSGVHLTIREGKFHQVKRMFEAFGMKVVYLKRLSMGKLILDESLACGEYRELTKQEIEDLQGVF